MQPGRINKITPPPSNCINFSIQQIDKLMQFGRRRDG